MVFFNDPVPVEEHELQAIRFALAAQERFAELAERGRNAEPSCGLGVGIEAGYATLGRIGFEGRYDYGALGPVTNLASASAPTPPAEQILIGQRVVRGGRGASSTASSRRRARAQGVRTADRRLRDPWLAHVRGLKPEPRAHPPVFSNAPGRTSEFPTRRLAPCGMPPARIELWLNHAVWQFLISLIGSLECATNTAIRRDCGRSKGARPVSRRRPIRITAGIAPYSRVLRGLQTSRSARCGRSPGARSRSPRTSERSRLSPSSATAPSSGSRLMFAIPLGTPVVIRS